jgi:hypothetical protein
MKLANEEALLKAGWGGIKRVKITCKVCEVVLLTAQVDSVPFDDTFGQMCHTVAFHRIMMGHDDPLIEWEKQ